MVRQPDLSVLMCQCGAVEHHKQLSVRQPGQSSLSIPRANPEARLKGQGYSP